VVAVFALCGNIQPATIRTIAYNMQPAIGGVDVYETEQHVAGNSPTL
jgi:hypothetical protein